MMRFRLIDSFLIDRLTNQMIDLHISSSLPRKTSIPLSHTFKSKKINMCDVLAAFVIFGMVSRLLESMFRDLVDTLRTQTGRRKILICISMVFFSSVVINNYQELVTPDYPRFSDDDPEWIKWIKWFSYAIALGTAILETLVNTENKEERWAFLIIQFGNVILLDSVEFALQGQRDWTLVIFYNLILYANVVYFVKRCLPQEPDHIQPTIIGSVGLFLLFTGIGNYNRLTYRHFISFK